MSELDKKTPIVIKKIRKPAHGHHGGAWKVAYADFVTAMMAFFLLLWLLGNTTEAQREGISNFFEHPSGIQGPGGASTSMIKLGGNSDPKQPVPQPDPEPNGLGEAERDEGELRDDRDKRRLEQLRDQLLQQIEANSSLRDFSDQLLIDITPDGLRIQIVDHENRPMFNLGSSRMMDYARDILDELASTINSVPNRISVTGHTDARAYAASRADYSNWELSSERANAARRALVAGGLEEGKVGRIVGLASSVPFNRADPNDPINRRISIIVLNRAAEQAIGLEANPAGNVEPAGALPDAPTATSTLAPLRANPAIAGESAGPATADTVPAIAIPPIVTAPAAAAPPATAAPATPPGGATASPTPNTNIEALERELRQLLTPEAVTER